MNKKDKQKIKMHAKLSIIGQEDAAHLLAGYSWVVINTAFPRLTQGPVLATLLTASWKGIRR